VPILQVEFRMQTWDSRVFPHDHYAFWRECPTARADPPPLRPLLGVKRTQHVEAWASASCRLVSEFGGHGDVEGVALERVLGIELLIVLADEGERVPRIAERELRRGRVFHANGFLAHNAKRYQDSSENHGKDESRRVVHLQISVSGPHTIRSVWESPARSQDSPNAAPPTLGPCSKSL
jgi:hypothetical protein